MSKKPVSALTIYEATNRKSLSVLNTEQILHIMQKTPPDHIYTRPAKGGGEWDYVTGTYIKKVLNYVFGWDWDFEIKQTGREGDLVFVLGRLTVRVKKGSTIRTIVKEQFGRADIKFKKGTQVPLDYGNDLKAASTDALKKCASELGIASDVYGKNEFKEIQMVEPQEATLLVDGTKPATESQVATIKSLDPNSDPDSANLTKQEAADKISQLSQGGKNGSK